MTAEVLAGLEEELLAEPLAEELPLGAGFEPLEHAANAMVATTATAPTARRRTTVLLMVFSLDLAPEG